MLETGRPGNVPIYHWTLYKKFALSIFISMIVSLVGGISILYNNVYHGLVSMNNVLNENNLAGARDNINQMVVSVENEVTTNFLYKEFREAVMNPNETFENAEFFNTTQSLVVRSMVRMPYLRNIIILKTNGANYYTEIPAPSLGFSDYNSCYSKLLYNRNKIIDWNGIAGWYSSVENPSTKPAVDCLLHVRAIYDVSRKKPVAIVLSYLDETSVCSLYDFFGTGSFMMDKKGTIVSAMEKDLIGTSIRDMDLYQKVIASKKNTVCGKYIDNGRGKPFSCTYLPSLACYIVAIPDYSLFSTIQKAISINAVYLLIFGAFFALLLAVILAKRIASPITKLKYAMTKAMNGELQTRFSSGKTDEIAYLGTSFNTLMDTIESYIHDIKEKEEDKRQSELRFLQAQINPHLLYNTLDSALYFISKNEVEKACSSIEALSEFFKLSLNKGKMFVTIETELYQVKQFMEIQRLCREKNITLEVVAETRLLKKEIVKTTLQPIVENSYLHAFTDEFCTGHIRIELKESDAHIIISVTDNGMGMDDMELATVRGMLLNSKESRKGFGLWNVNRRLKNCYGEDCGLTIDSEFGEYTRVTVTILSKEGENNV